VIMDPSGTVASHGLAVFGLHRRELLQRNNLDGTLQEVKKLLDEAVLAERKELARALDDDARFNEMRIESLPPSPAKAVQELENASDEDRQRVNEMLDDLNDLLDKHSRGEDT
jgi:uncharacterized protein with von Willebrand factor type A (vWA) domain